GASMVAFGSNAAIGASSVAFGSVETRMGPSTVWLGSSARAGAAAAAPMRETLAARRGPPQALQKAALSGFANWHAGQFKGRSRAESGYGTAVRLLACNDYLSVTPGRQAKPTLRAELGVWWRGLAEILRKSRNK